MSVVFNPVITQAGRDAAFLAASNGVSLAITAIAFGSGAPYDPTGAETELVSEQKRVTIAAGSRITPQQIRVAAVWQADMGTFPINEIAIYAGSTLFAIWSSTIQAPIATKTPGVDFVFYYDLLLAFLPANSVTVTVDGGQSAILTALGNHLNDQGAHPQYLKIVDLANNQDLTYLGTAAGTADALTLALTVFQIVPAYKDGLRFLFRAASANTGAATVNIGGIGVKALRKQGTVALSAGDLVAGGLYEIVYDGTNFQVVSLVAVNANTAAQFNDSLLIANTAFVRRALGSFSGNLSVSGATATLVAADSGKRIVSSATTLNLPATAGLPDGASFNISVATATMSLVANGADRLNAGTGLINAVSVSLANGTYVQAVKVAAGVWVLIGSAVLKFEDQFGGSLSASGYQKLPSGLIIQWGTASAAAGGTVITLPIAFPTAFLNGLATSAVGNTACAVTAGTTTTITVSNATTGNTRYLAIGY